MTYVGREGKEEERIEVKKWEKRKEKEELL